MTHSSVFHTHGRRTSASWSLEGQTQAHILTFLSLWRPSWTYYPGPYVYVLIRIRIFFINPHGDPFPPQNHVSTPKQSFKIVGPHFASRIGTQHVRTHTHFDIRYCVCVYVSSQMSYRDKAAVCVSNTNVAPSLQH